MKNIKKVVVWVLAAIIWLGVWLCPDVDSDDFWNGMS